MKIEILLCDNINEECSGMTAFNTSSFIHKKIRHLNQFQGIVLIDNVPVKFSYSSLGDDGDIFSENQSYRSIVKAVVPLFIFSNVNNGLYPTVDAEV
jgi:hypothetical protein